MTALSSIIAASLAAGATSTLRETLGLLLALYLIVGQFWMVAHYAVTSWRSIGEPPRRFDSFSDFVEITGGDVLAILARALAWPYFASQRRL